MKMLKMLRSSLYTGLTILQTKKCISDILYCRYSNQRTQKYKNNGYIYLISIINCTIFLFPIPYMSLEQSWKTLAEVFNSFTHMKPTLSHVG